LTPSVTLVRRNRSRPSYGVDLCVNQSLSQTPNLRALAAVNKEEPCWHYSGSLKAGDKR
jgi:hypothetical protein